MWWHLPVNIIRTYCDRWHCRLRKVILYIRSGDGSGKLKLKIKLFSMCDANAKLCRWMDGVIYS
jgi:hypothetical protein